MNKPRVHREVTSFVRRSTRMTLSQERAWAERERWVIPVPRQEGSTLTSVAPDAEVDWPHVFGRTAPLVVEIGAGTGDSLTAMAAVDPERDHVAFEVFRPALAATMIKLRDGGVENVRLVDADGVAGLTHLFSPGQIDELWTFFPDPWHKTRHTKRRLVSTEFADLVAERLTPGGLWRIATDWEDYALHCRETLDPHPALENVHGPETSPGSGGWAPRLATRPVTKYERRGLAAGRQVFDLTYRRCP